MLFFVKHTGQPSKELRFRTGPIYIGRQLGSQIFLPDKTVSRQHAVIYSTTDGDWILEDLDSANKTFLNGKAIHKAVLSDGDMFSISQFNIEVKFRETSSQPTKINMDDTLISPAQEIRSITRKIKDTNGPAFKLSPEGIKQYSEMTCEIAKSKNLDQLLDTLIGQIKKQLFSFHLWIGFKEKDSNSFYKYKGKVAAGQSLKLEDISLKGNILESMEKKEFLLIPRFNLTQKNKEKIRSAMIIPIINREDCLGVIYIDNSLNHEQYDIMNLNYMMLTSISLGNIISVLMEKEKDQDQR